MSVDLTGVVVPCTTPFDPVTGDVDLVGFRANVRSFLAHSVRGIVVGGSTGEAVLLDEDERMVLLQGARDLVPDDRLVVAGTGAESTRTTIRRCEESAGMGADAVLVQPPAFYRGAMTDAALLEHYRAVAAASPIPVILYQVPLRMSTLEFSSSLVADLAKIANVVGIKDSRGSLELVAEWVDRTPDTFQVLVGSGAILYGGLEVGAVGGVLAVANLAPGPASAIVRGGGGHWDRGDVVRMPLRSQRDLRFAQIRASGRGHLVVGPGLVDEPGDSVVSVLTVRGSERVLAFRYAAPARVLERNGVSGFDEERDGAPVRGLPVLPVRGPNQDGRIGRCRVRGEVQVG